MQKFEWVNAGGGGGGTPLKLGLVRMPKWILGHNPAWKVKVFFSMDSKALAYQADNKSVSLS